MSSTAGKRGKRKAPSNVGAKTATKKPRKPKGMPDFKPGEILIDLVKKSWQLGELIGWGGFGALYYASPDTEKAVDDKATYVAKVEPYTNGPLFGEIAFYQRAAKEETINKWISSHKLRYLGVPAYIGSGWHESGGNKFRFMIMERFGDDVDQIFAKCGKRFHVQTVFTLAIRIIDIFEYIHAQGYVHADMKGSNLMMGYKTNRKNEVFLLDYGLAFGYNTSGKHKEYKEDPKRKHDGTIEFTSRDAHKGVAPSCRSDLEILGYVMLQWLCGKLPWEDNLTDKEYVMNSKIKAMENISQFLQRCLKDQRVDELEQYLNYVVSLKYEQKPDYNKVKKIFQDGLRKRKFTDDGCTVKFKTAKMNGFLVEDFQDIAEDSEDSDSPVKGETRNAGGRKSRQTSSRKEPSGSAKATNKRAASPVQSASKKVTVDAAKSPKKGRASPVRSSSKRTAVIPVNEQTAATSMKRGTQKANTTSYKEPTSPAKASTSSSNKTANHTRQSRARAKKAGNLSAEETTDVEVASHARPEPNVEEDEPPPKRKRGRPKKPTGRGRPKKPE